MKPSKVLRTKTFHAGYLINDRFAIELAQIVSVIVKKILKYIFEKIFFCPYMWWLSGLLELHLLQVIILTTEEVFVLSSIFGKLNVDKMDR